MFDSGFNQERFQKTIARLRALGMPEDPEDGEFGPVPERDKDGNWTEVQGDGPVWAEVYRASGRLTGHFYPVVAGEEPHPGDIWFSSEDEAYQAFEEGVHNLFHSPTRPDWACSLCDREGWNK